MKYYYIISIIITLLSCNSETSETTQPVQTSKSKAFSPKDSFQITESKDTVRIDFKTREINYSPDLFNALIKEIVQHGAFRPETDKKGHIIIKQDSIENLTIGYDKEGLHYLTIEYILSNMHVESVWFKAPRTKKNPEFEPGFTLKEWTFKNNVDRDSAFNIFHYVYSYPGNIVMYDKSYPQIIKAENRIFFLTTGSDIFERYVIKYGKIVETLIMNNFK